MATLPASPLDGPTWLTDLRQRATDTVREGGLPGKKHEAWRFTSVRDVVDQPLRPLDERSAAAPEPAAWLDDDADPAFRIVLDNGRPTLDGTAPAGVTVRALREALEDNTSGLEGLLGSLAGTEHFAGLNAALFTDGLFLQVAPGAVVETPIHLVHVASGEGAAHARLLIQAGRSSQCTLVETFVDGDPGQEAAHLSNGVTEVRLEDNARLDHVRVTIGTARAMHIGQLAVSQAADSWYASRVVTLGGKLARLDVDVRQTGRGAQTELDGVYHVRGTEHVDHQIRVVHAESHGASHVRYRGLLDGRGHAVFNAMGIVDRGTVGNAAHQENRNLLLSSGARIDTKPHLEIDTDEIVASHGSTVGSLDDTQTFYLRSRGIPAAEARDLLTYAFVQELLDRIPHAPTQRRCSEAVLERLPHGERMREVLS